MNSASKSPRQGDKQNSPFFEEYLVTLESERLWTHILRGDPDSPEMLVRELRQQRIQAFFTRGNVAELTHAAGVEDELLELQARTQVLHDATHRQAPASLQPAKRRKTI